MTPLKLDRLSREVVFPSPGATLWLTWCLLKRSSSLKHYQAIFWRVWEVRWPNSVILWRMSTWLTMAALYSVRQAFNPVDMLDTLLDWN